LKDLSEEPIVCTPLRPSEGIAYQGNVLRKASLRPVGPTNPDRPFPADGGGESASLRVRA
jgi:hypothetical protein